MRVGILTFVLAAVWVLLLLSGESEPIDGTFEVHDLHDGEQVDIGPLRLEAVATLHSVETYALRASAGGRTLAYSADSGPCEALGRLADQADLFVCEAAWPQSPEGVPPIHLTPQQAGECAAKARARQCAHHCARSPRGRQRRAAEAYAARGFGTQLEVQHLMPERRSRQTAPGHDQLGWQETARLGLSKRTEQGLWRSARGPGAAVLRGSGRAGRTRSAISRGRRRAAGSEVSKAAGGRTPRDPAPDRRSLRAVTDTRRSGVEPGVTATSQAEAAPAAPRSRRLWPFRGRHRLQQERG